MIKIYIPLEQAWGNIPAAVSYFESIVEALHFYEKSSYDLSDLFLEIKSDGKKGYNLVITNL